MAERQFRTMLTELMKSGPGKAGLILLGLLVATSLVIVVTFPRNFGTDYWANPGYWADNPKSVPPVWANIFSGVRTPKHLIIDLSEPDSEGSTGRAFQRIYRMSFDIDADIPATFLSFSVSNVEYAARPPILTAVLVRPDGNEVTLVRKTVSGPRGERMFRTSVTSTTRFVYP